VFDREDTIARHAEAALEQGADLAAEFAVLVKEYRLLLGHSRKVTRLGDSAQKRLIKAQQRNAQMLAEIERAYAALEESQRQLQDELAEAAAYVRSLFPAPTGPPVSIDWRFITSTSLGGDAFGYHWIGRDYLAIYLLDVSGHGVGAALLSISAINVLRSQALPHADFRQPSSVVEAMNDTFRMEQQHNKFFTLWYGVYQPQDRVLRFASAGHPPSVLFEASAPDTPIELKAPGLVVGALQGNRYPQHERLIPPGSRLFLFSDGVYEVFIPESDELWNHDQFLASLARCSSSEPVALDSIIEDARRVQDAIQFSDDYSLLRLTFA
jgi:sigma-B regulation protein RsbU (phosphoserine phosphatase)